MEHFREWIRHNCTIDKLKYLKNNMDIHDPQTVKLAIYLGFSAVAFVLLVQHFLSSLRNKKYSRLPARSPDPEKPKESREKIKASERPFGGIYASP